MTDVETLTACAYNLVGTSLHETMQKLALVLISAYHDHSTKTCVMATTFKLGRFTHLLGRAPDAVFPLADQGEDAINNALKATSRATFVRAQKGTKRPCDDANVKTRFPAKHWLNVLDQTGHESGRVTHSDFEMLKEKMENKSVVVVVPVPSDDEPGEPMNQCVRLKDLMSAHRHPFHVEQEGQSFFQVPMKMKANNIGLLNGDAALEIKVNSETPAQQMLLSHEDIVCGNVLLFGARNDASSKKNFHQTFKTMEFFNKQTNAVLNAWLRNLNTTPINWHNCSISFFRSK
jgi:hypothetical protein